MVEKKDETYEMFQYLRNSNSPFLEVCKMLVELGVKTPKPKAETKKNHSRN